MKNINIHRLGSLKNDLPRMKTGDTVRVSEKILEESKKKSQVFEGILISKKHGKGVNATFTLRSIVEGVGVEKTYPLHSPLIEKIQVIKKGRARRAKLYYLREKAEKKIRRKLKSKRVQIKQEVVPKEKIEKKEASKKEIPKETKRKEEEKKPEKK